MINNHIKYIPKKILKLFSKSGFGAKKVNFFILGAQKCGTSSVFDYLTAHPNTTPAYNKETGFFNKDHFFNQGTDYFHSCFPYQRANDFAYEATPENLLYPYIAQRIYDYNPDAKFIIMLRDPVKRAFSSWNMIRIYLSDPVRRTKSIQDFHSQFGNPPHKATFDYLLSLENYLSFDEFVEQELTLPDFENFNIGVDFIRRGLYAPQLERYLELFPIERFFFIDIDEMKKEVNDSISQLVNFLELPPITWNIPTSKRSNSNAYSTKITHSTEKRLRNFYKPYNEQLVQLTGKNYKWCKPEFSNS